MKTYLQWIDSGQTLNSFLKPGDIVDDAMADYFREILPPRTMKSELIQIGEAYDHCRDQNGKIRNIYATLVKKDNVWIYAGNCFSGESEPAQHHLFLIKTSENPEFGFTFYQNKYRPEFHYMLDCHHQWHSMDKTGQLTGRLKAGLVIHILDDAGKQLLEEITHTPEE